MLFEEANVTHQKDFHKLERQGIKLSWYKCRLQVLRLSHETCACKAPDTADAEEEMDNYEQDMIVTSLSSAFPPRIMASLIAKYRLRSAYAFLNNLIVNDKEEVERDLKFQTVWDMQLIFNHDKSMISLVNPNAGISNQTSMDTYM